MTAVECSIEEWLDIVRGEFQEIPGLHLTKPQVRRLWSLDEQTCDILLDTLVRDRFLRTMRDQYVRA
jgi:hypothetical protein